MEKELQAIVADLGERGTFFERLTRGLLYLLVFLMPIFFIPGVNYQYNKGTLFFVSVALLLVFWIISRLKEGKITVSRHPLVLALLALPVAFILATIFSGSPATSFAGLGHEVGTLLFIATATLLSLLTAILLDTKKRIFDFYALFAVMALAVVLFHTLRISFGAPLTSSGLFSTGAGSLLGKWNELGLFFGLTGIISLVALESLMGGSAIRRIAWVSLIVSFVSLAFIDFPAVWYVVGLFALISSIHALSFRKETVHTEGGSLKNAARRIAVPSLVALALSLVLIFAGDNINRTVSSKFAIAQLEVRPNWQSTIEVAKASLTENLLFGVGPNRFAIPWLLYKPPAVNQSVFWAADFNYGVGLIPTFVVTTGLIGFLACLLFFGAFVFQGMRAILSPSRVSGLERFFVLSSFFGAAYLWIFTVIYVPGFVMTLFAFLFTGVFLASLREAGMIRLRRVDYSKDAKSNFSVVLVLILLLIASVSVGYLVIQKFMGAIVVGRGVAELNAGKDRVVAGTTILRGIRINPNEDDYYRIYSDFVIGALPGIIQEKNVSEETIRNRFQAALTDALNATELALKQNETDYQNWVARGRVYESLVSLNIPGAYESAKAAYEKALERNPYSPALQLVFARLELARGNSEAALVAISKALQLKPNYIDAVFLESQIEVSRNNVKGAIGAVEKGVALAPNDPVVFFQLGFLKYSNKDYKGAITALERSIVLNPEYSNARYFLGLSYWREGRNADAIAEFLEIQKFNHDNDEVKLILSNLRAGRSPFADARPPLDEAPEKRPQPPLQESL